MGEAPGTRRLRFRETLGQGAFGTVYLADLSTPQGLQQRVAVKVLNLDGPDAREMVARHKDEARLLALLNHDHIVKVNDLIEVQGRMAFILEYVEGVNTDRLVRRAGALPPRAALSVLSAVAGALDAAYNAESPNTGRPLRVIHRDIKPANILLSVGGGVKVLDFGIARADFDRDAETRTGNLGTPAFMAPEVFTGAPITPAVDVYALGLTLSRLLTGAEIERLPAHAERLVRAREAMLRPLQDLPGADAWRARLLELLRAMMAFSSADRPSSAEVQDACLALTDEAPGEGLVVYARRVLPPLVAEQRGRTQPRGDPLPSEMTLSGSAPSADLVPPRPAPRRVIGLAGLAAAGALTGAGLGAAALAGFAVWFWGMGGGGPDERVVDPVTAPSAPAPTPASAEAATGDAAAEDEPEPATADAPQEAGTTSGSTRATRAAKQTRASTAKRYPVTINSIPFGAAVRVDGKQRCDTPCFIELSEGDHTLRLQMPEGASSSKSVQVGEYLPTRFTWNVEAGTWDLGI